MLGTTLHNSHVNIVNCASTNGFDSMCDHKMKTLRSFKVTDIKNMDMCSKSEN